MGPFTPEPSHAEPQVPLLMQVPSFIVATISVPVWALLSVTTSNWSFRFL